MNTATLDYHGSRPRSLDLQPMSSAGRRWMMKIFIAVLVIWSIWGLIATTQLTTAMNEASELRATNVRLVGTNRQLTDDAKAVPGLKAELARKQSALNTEISRKKELATMYERAEAGRKQAVADHAAALRQIAALEKAGAGKKPASRRK